MRIRVWKCLVFLITFSGSVAADGLEAPNCPLPPDAGHWYSVADLPEAIRTDFTTHIHNEIAAPGAAFQETDVIEDLPIRRLVEIRHFQTRWVILYEVGGLAPHLHLVAYDLDPSG